MAIKYTFNPFSGKLDAFSEEAPAGSDTYVQFNDGGVFGGDSGLTYNKTTNNLGIDNVQWNLTPTPTTPSEGLMYWNVDDGTLNLGMPGGNVNLQLGQETIARCRNNSGVDIKNGQPVYITGTQANRPAIALAKGDAEATAYVFGVATEDIDDGSWGFVSTDGYVRDFDTTGGVEAWSAGDILYVSKTTAGALTNVEPIAPHHQDKVGQVINADGTNGVILVRIRHHRTLDELSDIDGTPLTTNGQFLVWNNTLGYWDANYNITDYALLTDAILKVPTGATSNTIAIPNANYNGLIIKGFTAQTADALQIQNSSGTVLSYFDSSGGLVLGTPNFTTYRGFLDVTTANYPPMRLTRTTTASTGAYGIATFTHKTTGVMSAGFGGIFAIELFDSTNYVASISNPVVYFGGQCSGTVAKYAGDFIVGTYGGSNGSAARIVEKIGYYGDLHTYLQAGVVGHTIHLSSGTTSDALQIQNSSGTVLTYFDKDGYLQISSNPYGSYSSGSTLKSTGRFDLMNTDTTAYGATSYNVGMMRVAKVHNSGGAGQYAGFVFQVSGDSTSNNAVGQIHVLQEAAGSSASSIVFQTRNSAASYLEPMRINSLGEVIVNNNGNAATTANLLKVKLSGSHTGDAFQIQNSSSTVLSRFNENGWLGIGVDPSYPAHIYNNQNAGTRAYIDNPNTGGSAFAGVVVANSAGTFSLTVRSTGYTDDPTLANYGVFRTDSALAGLVMSTGGSKPLIIKTNDTERMRILGGTYLVNDGYVGINTAVPGAQLQITTGGTTTIGEIIKLSASQTADALQIQNSSGTNLAVINELGDFERQNIGASSIGSYNFYSDSGSTLLGRFGQYGSSYANYEGLTYISNGGGANAGTVIYGNGVPRVFFGGSGGIRILDGITSTMPTGVSGAAMEFGYSAGLGYGFANAYNRSTSTYLEYWNIANKLSWYTNNNAGSGDVRAYMDQVGQFVINPNVSTPTTSVLQTIKLTAAHTADALEIQNSSGSNLFYITKDGAFVANEQGADADSRIEGNTEDNLFYVDAGLDEVHLGDHDTNYAAWSKTGTLTLNGTAKYERHIQIEATLTGNAATQPTPDDIGSVGGLVFSSATNQSCFVQWEVPDDWDGTDVYIEVDWAPYSAAMTGTDTIKWDVDYRSIAEGETLTNGTLAQLSNTDSTDYAQYQTKHTRLTLPFNDANQPLTAQDHIYFEVRRDTGVANDFAGTVIVTAFEIIYTSKGFPTSN